ncbi:MAG: septum formation initiator family protein [Bacteroidetes bacterium]|nr:septum formation initiator family protein [Bacteroidota bacterium]
MLKLLKNKYFITLIVFVAWMIFFDQNSFVFQAKISKELNQLKARKKFYINQNNVLLKQKNDLEKNLLNLEKLAREKYLMKRDDEDVFIVNTED